MNDNFIISIDYDKTANHWQAHFADGQTVELLATNYADALCEADSLVINYELGYN